MKKKLESTLGFFFEEKEIMAKPNSITAVQYHETQDIYLKKACPHFETYVNFFSFFLLIPFRCKLENNTMSGYKVVSSKIRKVFSSIAQLINLAVGSILLYRNVSMFVNKRRDISTAFYVTSYLFTLLSMILSIKIFHFNITKVVEFMNEWSAPIEPRKDKKARLVVFFLSVIIVGTCIGHQYSTTLGDSDMSYICQTLKSILSPVWGKLGLDSGEWLANMVPNGVLYHAGMIIICYHYIMVNTQLVLMLTISLIMNNSVQTDFINKVEQNYGKIPAVLNEYQKLKKSVAIITTLFGSFILSYYVCVLAFFAEIPQILPMKNAEDGNVRIFMVIYMCKVIAAMYFAASFNGKVDRCLRKFISFHHWQYQSDRECKQRLQLIALTQEIDAEPLGVSCGFFVITKGFLGSTISLVITYSLIVFQMDQMSSEKGNNFFWQI